MSFVAQDLTLLREKYQVEEYFVKSDLPQPWRDFLRVWRSDLVFCWFASGHSLLPVLWAWLLRKPALVVVGGYDVANLPEINYGHQRGGLKTWLTRPIFKAATRLLPVSEYNYNEALKNGRIPARKLTLVYNALPVDNFKLPATETSRPNILTVGNVNESNLERKGLRLFVEAARRLPEHTFVVVGNWADTGAEKLKALAPANVTLTGRVSAEELARQYAEAAVYVQVSRHEAFGVAVAEAMLQGCLPVLSRAGALPEVGGDCAVYVEEFSAEAVATAIEQALALAGPARAAACRAHIAENFSLDKRRAALYAQIDRLTAN